MRNYISKILKCNLFYLIQESSSISLVDRQIPRILLRFIIDLKSSLIENILLIYICILYYASTFLIGHFIGFNITGNVLYYYIDFFEYLFAFFFFMWSFSTVVYLIRNPKEGFNGIPIIWSKLKEQYICPTTISRFMVIFSLLPIFACSYSSIKQTIPLWKFFSFDLTFYKIDKVLHFNHSPWEILQSVIGHPQITLFIDFCYLAWVSLFVYSLLYMACHSDRQLRLKFFISLACCWILIGNILAILFSSAGPCYFSEVTGVAANPYAGLFEYLNSISGIRAVGIQTSLWEAFQIGRFMPLGGISAMPSMHVSIAVLLALLYRNIDRWAGWLLIFFAVVIQIGSIHLGWHYAVDGYLSATVTILIWKIVGRKLA